MVIEIPYANTDLLLKCLAYVSCMRGTHCSARFFPTFLPTFPREFRSPSIFLHLLQPPLPSLLSTHFSSYINILLSSHFSSFKYPITPLILLLYQSLPPSLHPTPTNSSELFHMVSLSLLNTTTLFPSIPTRSILACTTTHGAHQPAVSKMTFPFVPSYSPFIFNNASSMEATDPAASICGTDSANSASRLAG